ncbi:alpha-1,3/1,6-mannosyltransferase ALG2 [Octopus bimaculoides]|uniref:Alpha-1,3/1,6-mannosyltransferase ALG2 n=1 Tax=Octopus bimaculoides TaxID=37653 RepID=A0A0L8H1R3_OCTBM|nr:alpha-1,3/1,6-mannosyltransferase ALG2 [Octopus bimaculoides]|eukprot:XP_014776147.1 PREDICTED: alpha-1,3/1,6-mannosyltransferase ALG2-like [Octopus bimaculoides]
MLNIVFVHPDLGIGGAERAVVDAAMALKSRGHTVRFLTAHHDREHCFEETTDGSLNVTEVGGWIPTNLCGHMFAFWAYVRMIYVAFYLVWSGMACDLVIVDQVSACIPILRLRSSIKVLFYCHYPDMLLTGRETLLKAMYRAPLDWLEETTTGQADVVLVNSKFTAEIFRTTFKKLSHINPQVLYPIPNFSAFNTEPPPATDDLLPRGKKHIFLSINRYERKKNLALALQAFKKLEEQLTSNSNVHLVVAGGYDERVTENRQYYLELRQMAAKLQIEDSVTFVRSFTSNQKLTLLSQVTCLLYTPDKEHFGIVPVEAMYMKLPVVAVASGGPLETVEHGETGFLCPAKAGAFAEAMQKFIDGPHLKQSMGEKGRSRVEKLFSFDVFTEKLDNIVESLCNK